MAGKPQVAIRLGTEGKAQVQSDFKEIADAGDAAASRLQKRFDQQTEAVEAAMQRQAATAAKLAAIQPQTPLQAQINQNVGTGLGTDFEGSARRSALAMKDLLAQEDALTQRAETLRRAVDPLYSAQQRYDTEIREANALLAAGKIGQDVHTAAVAASQRALNLAKKELDGHTSSLGLNRMQAITAQSAVLRFTDAILSGRSPLTAFALEAHKGAEILSLDDGGMAGGLSKVKGLLTLTTVALGVTAVAVGVAGFAWLSYANDMAKLEAIAQGTGRILGESATQLEANAEAAASAGNISVSSAEKIEQGYLRIAKSGDVLVGLTAITRDFAAATGQDMHAAQQELVGDFGDTIQGAHELAEKYGLLSQAQADEIAKLVEEGQLEQAQAKLLDDLKGKLDGAADHAEGLAKAWHDIATEASNAWRSVGRFLNDYGGYGLYALSPGLGALAMPGAQQGRAGGNQAAGNQAMQGAMALVRSYQGDDRSQLQARIGTIRAAMAAGGTPDQLHELTTALEANEHALKTWMPAEEKATALAANAVRVAQAKTPAEKAAAAAERTRLEQAGQVITYANAQAQATDKAAAAAAHAKEHHDKHAEALAREAAAMEVDTAETLKLAEAYLTIGESTIIAEARRKAMTDATKKGIDVEAQVRRQVALTVANDAAASAKSVGVLREENAARAGLNDQLAAGTINAADYNQQLHDEDALRPLLKLKLLAHGDALRVVTDLIKAYTDALRESHDEEARTAALTEADAALRHSADTLALMKFAGDPQQRALEAARLAALHEADDKGMTGDARDTFLRSKADEAQTDLASQRADYVAKTLRDQGDSLTLTQRETQLVAANDNNRQAELDKLQKILELKKEGIDPESEVGQAILANLALYDQEQEKLRQLTANFAELKSFGDQFLGDVLNPDNWKNWGSFGMMVLHDLETEIEKLALLNPLKNWLLGENNPTAGGVMGLLGKLFGGGSSSFAGLFSTDFGSLGAGVGDFGSLFADVPLPAFASGTDSAPGGLALAGEEGPELVNLPRGSRVTPAAETRRLLAANDGGIGSVTLNMPIYAPGADAAALDRAIAEVRDLKRALPGTIVATVMDARKRRVL